MAFGNRTNPVRIAAVLIASLAPLVTSAQANVTISSNATKNMTCSGGVCTATKANAVLNVNDLQNMLASSSIAVATGTKALDINVAAALTWASGNSLALDATRSIAIAKPMTVNGGGGLALTTNQDGNGGSLSFGKKGSVTFFSLASSLIVNDINYALANSIAMLAGDIAANPQGSYALANSYNATADGTYPASPIATTLTGRFNGLGNTISHLSINDPTAGDNIGLFAQVGAGGTAGYLHLVRATIKGVGGIVGGKTENTGGFVGMNQGNVAQVELCNGTVTGGYETYVGGAVGDNEGAIYQVSSCLNVKGAYGNVALAGGLAGENGGTITLSSATGTVAGGTFLFIGGLVGSNDGTITYSFASGGVTGGDAAGVGGLAGENSNTGLIGASYATGAAATGNAGFGTATVGGLAGVNVSSNAIQSAYSIGAVTGGTGSYIGGLLGIDYSAGLVTNYWDTTTSGITNLSQGAGSPANDPGITGLTTAQLQSGLPPGFSGLVWGENASINGGLPYLLFNPP